MGSFLSTGRQVRAAENKPNEEIINSLPLVRALRSQTCFQEFQPHLDTFPHRRAQSSFFRTLQGHGRMWTPPLAWIEEGGKSLVMICYLGLDLCSYPGIAHGGLLATILDEGFVSCCCEALQRPVVVTASLTVNYKAPTYVQHYIVVRVKTREREGRKIRVEGRIETLVEAGHISEVLVEAEALFVAPKWSGESQ